LKCEATTDPTILSTLACSSKGSIAKAREIEAKVISASIFLLETKWTAFQIPWMQMGLARNCLWEKTILVGGFNPSEKY